MHEWSTVSRYVYIIHWQSTNNPLCSIICIWIYIYIHMPLHYCLLWCADSWQKNRSRQISRSAFTQSLEMSCWRLAACHLSKTGEKGQESVSGTWDLQWIYSDPTPPWQVGLCADECALVRFHADGQWHPSSPCCTMARDQDGPRKKPREDVDVLRNESSRAVFGHGKPQKIDKGIDIMANCFFCLGFTVEWLQSTNTCKRLLMASSFSLEIYGTVIHGATFNWFWLARIHL